MHKKIKQYPFRFKLRWDGIEWGQSELTVGSGAYFYYFFWWNLLPAEYRKFGIETMWYDGPHKAVYLWFISISWSTRWTKEK